MVIIKSRPNLICFYILYRQCTPLLPIPRDCGHLTAMTIQECDSFQWKGDTERSLHCSLIFSSDFSLIILNRIRSLRAFKSPRGRQLFRLGQSRKASRRRLNPLLPKPHPGADLVLLPLSQYSAIIYLVVWEPFGLFSLYYSVLSVTKLT